VLDDCYYYGICLLPEPTNTFTVLSVGKLVSCLGGLLIWFIIFFWGLNCLPDFEARASTLLAKVKKSLKVNVIDEDLLVITHEE